MPLDLIDFPFESGTNNIPGTSREILLALIDDIDTFPALPDAPASIAEHVTIADNFVFNEGKGFHRFYVTPRTGRLRFEKVGPYDSEHYMNRFECFHPGGSVNSDYLAKIVKNNNLVAIITELDGTKRLMGNNLRPVRVETLEVDHGVDGGDDGKGLSIVFEYTDNIIAPRFTGQAPLASESASA